MSIQESQDRLRKAQEIRDLGVNPYPARFESTHSVAQAVELGQTPPRTVEQILEAGPTAQVTLRGRLMTLREHGRLAFANLKDFTGTIQICFMESVLGAENYKRLKLLDMGDFLGCSGELFMTKHGQLTVLIKEWTFLGKALRPLPEKWHGLQDQEAKYRQRYLDLTMSDETMQRFLLRSRFIESVRRFLNQHQFLEVETPILSTVASGATARPFATHHNALDLDVQLRIAPELFLKRCIAGGFERVYEFAKCFRNEGMDPSHLQEFTMLEYYGAYWNYEDNMNFTEQMLSTVIQELFGTLTIRLKSRDGQDLDVDFTAPWPRLDFGELIRKDSGIDIYAHEDAKSLRAQIKKAGLTIEDTDTMGYGNLCDALYKKVSRPKLINPCFVINHPASTKPLARRSDANPKVCETFQLLVNTWEVVNAYSELVDPEDQRQRFLDQAEAKAGGDQDAMDMDTDYVTCMEHGMPPISGFGMGIDRIVTLLTGQDNLKDVVLFPLMRPLETAPAAPTPKVADKPLKEISTELLYMKDMQAVDFTAQVKAVVEGEKTAVILDQTAFYPQGGGQPYDQGTLHSKSAQFTVEEVRVVEGEVHHLGVFKQGSFQPGETVEGTIDPVRRTLLTRLHSAGHLIDVALKNLNIDWEPAKGYHYPQGAYVEYEGSLQGLDKDALKTDLEAELNSLIAKGGATRLEFNGKRRTVHYGSLGILCGGTHVANLADIGRMNIRKIKMEGEKIRVGYEVE